MIYVVFSYGNAFAIFQLKSANSNLFITTKKGRRCRVYITNFKIILMRLKGNKYQMTYEAPFYYLSLFYISFLLYQEIDFLISNIFLN